MGAFDDVIQGVIKERDQLKSLAKKLVLCFPDEIPEDQQEVSFNIPAYIIEELKEAIKEK